MRPPPPPPSRLPAPPSTAATSPLHHWCFRRIAVSSHPRRSRLGPTPGGRGGGPAHVTDTSKRSNAAHCSEPLAPNNRLTGTFSWINPYRRQFFLIKCCHRGLSGIFSVIITADQCLVGGLSGISGQTSTGCLEYSLVFRQSIVCRFSSALVAVAVGTPVTRRPPHESRRAALPHRAPASGLTRRHPQVPAVRRLSACDRETPALCPAPGMLRPRSPGPAPCPPPAPPVPGATLCSKASSGL